MRLVTFIDDNESRPGVLDAATGRIHDLRALDPMGPVDLADWIAHDVADGAIRRLTSSGTPRIPLEAVRLDAPIPRPRRNLLCVGKNYYEHAEEFHKSGFDASAGKTSVPEVPIIFTKRPNAVVGPGTPIDASQDPTHSVDYEGELTIVIGRGGRGIPKARAPASVYGYTIINDVTSRTLQNRHRQWFVGKNFDTFCPMGPCIVTADEIPDPTQLVLETRVNGELRQRASVAQLIFDIPTLIETLSSVMTLEPVDLIATGTCAGVGIGFDPPRFLKPGDRVSITIEPIGTLDNPVV